VSGVTQPTGTVTLLFSDIEASTLPLAPVRDPDLVLPTMAQALDLRERPGESIATTVRSYLSDRETALVLDNFAASQHRFGLCVKPVSCGVVGRGTSAVDEAVILGFAVASWLVPGPARPSDAGNAQPSRRYRYFAPTPPSASAARLRARKE